ncbi:MAG TPA: hypothetical protein VFQ05_01845 [Candidatus Eisenbacteria bacterium]|nr:hypothetical protein [Candidatus Eisenbacteria bacterium]
MKLKPIPRLALLAAIASILALPAVATKPRDDDPLESEIRRWTAWVRDTTSKDELVVDARQSAGPLLARAEKARAAGRRSLALFRLSAVRGNLMAAQWAASRPKAEREERVALEAAWRREAKSLGHAPKIEGDRSALCRAMSETAARESQSYYDASLSYGQSTAPQYGLYYMGLAYGQSDLVRWLGTWRDASPRSAMAMRSPAPEIEQLQQRLLLVYRPPLSIDRHPEFIRASAALKEARELDAAGLRHGALLQVLYAALRAAPLVEPRAPVDTASLDRRVTDLERQLAAEDKDHGIANLFLEIAREDLAQNPAHPAQAAAVVSEVMPLYIGALGPLPAAAAPRPAKVTVTLVRWPYT